MTQPLPALNVDELRIDQRLDLIALLWDSIPDNLGSLPVPEWHRAEVERRLADADANPKAGIPWETVKRGLKVADRS